MVDTFKYITLKDLYNRSQKRLVEESIKDPEINISEIEADQIAIVSVYLQDRYNCDKIFTTPIRNGILVDIISFMVLYTIFGRNKGRKISSDIKDDYNKATSKLDQIHLGKLNLGDALKYDTDDERSSGYIVYGNTSNKNFFV